MGRARIDEVWGAGKPALGVHCVSADLAFYEIAGQIGYDFVWIDTEHTYMSYKDVLCHLNGARSSGIVTVVRLPQNDLTYTKRVLEMGPDGIIFPMVRSAEEAETLLSYTLYPPYGSRGCGPQRAVRYGFDNEAAYVRSGPMDLCRFLQIESKAFIDDLEKIVDNPYIDGFILGLADLSGSIGQIGDIFGKDNLALAQRAIDVATAHGKIVGSATQAADEETLRMLHGMGIKMITCGADFCHVVNGAKKTFETVKKVIG